MEDIRKGTKIRKILDDNYIMFEDNWFNEHDKILFNQNDEEFLVLDFMEIEEELPILPLIPVMPIPVRRTYTQTFSCVKLNKNVNINDIFYHYKL